MDQVTTAPAHAEALSKIDDAAERLKMTMHSFPIPSLGNEQLIKLIDDLVQVASMSLEANKIMAHDLLGSSEITASLDRASEIVSVADLHAVRANIHQINSMWVIYYFCLLIYADQYSIISTPISTSFIQDNPEPFIVGDSMAPHSRFFSTMPHPQDRPCRILSCGHFSTRRSRIPTQNNEEDLLHTSTREEETKLEWIY